MHCRALEGRDPAPSPTLSTRSVLCQKAASAAISQYGNAALGAGNTDAFVPPAPLGCLVIDSVAALVPRFPAGWAARSAGPPDEPGIPPPRSARNTMVIFISQIHVIGVIRLARGDHNSGKASAPSSATGRRAGGQISSPAGRTPSCTAKAQVYRRIDRSRRQAGVVKDPALVYSCTEDRPGPHQGQSPRLAAKHRPHRRKISPGRTTMPQS